MVTEALYLSKLREKSNTPKEKSIVCYSENDKCEIDRYWKFVSHRNFFGGAWPNLTKLCHMCTGYCQVSFFCVRRARTTRIVRVAPRSFQHGGRRISSSARVYKFSLLCFGFASISGTNSGNSEVDLPTPVHAVASPLNTCREVSVARVALVVTIVSRRVVRQARHTTFSCAKMHSLDSVS